MITLQRRLLHSVQKVAKAKHDAADQLGLARTLQTVRTYEATPVHELQYRLKQPAIVLPLSDD